MTMPTIHHVYVRGVTGINPNINTKVVDVKDGASDKRATTTIIEHFHPLIFQAILTEIEAERIDKDTGELTDFCFVGAIINEIFLHEDEIT